jgi:hypothetical protein
MTFRIKPFDSVNVVASGAGVEAIPTTDVSSYTSTHSTPFMLNIYNNGASTIYIQASGSSEAKDGRFLLTGESATYGPVIVDAFPQLRFDAAGECWVSFDLYGAGV